MPGRLIAALFLAAAVAVSPAAGAPAQTPKRGGTVVVAWEGPPAFSPVCVFPTSCPIGFNAELTHLVLAGTLAVDPGGWVPNLVSRWSLERDPFAVTLRIRPGARWSDGRPITAADYVFSHRIYARLLPRDGYVWANVRRVTAIDAKTVRVEWSEPYGEWLGNTGLFPLSPRHVLRGANPAVVWEKAIANPQTGRPIASGPFLLERFLPGREIVLARNPRFWGPHPAYLDRLVIRFASNTADAFRAGDVDVIGGSGLDLAEALELAERPEREVRLIPGPGRSLEHLDLRVGPGGHPALKRKLVRRALAYGIDREAIVKELFATTFPTVRVLDSAAFLGSERSYEPNWSRYRYLPATARRLLEQAGCRRGTDGIYECAGERLRLRFVTRAGSPVRQRTLELIQRQLKEVGIEVVPFYSASFGFYEAGGYDVALFAWGNPLPGEAKHWAYTCDGRGAGHTGYCSRLFDADLEQLRRIVRPTRYAAVANRADRRLALDVPMIPLYQTPTLYAVRDSIRGIRPNAFWAIWWNVEDWWLVR